MQRLFNSSGAHIANESDGRLYAPGGSNVGRFIDSAEIFVDLNGRYLGEIVSDNRLLSRRSSPYHSVNYGNAGNAGNIGNYGNPGNHGTIGIPGGFEDVDPSRLE